jgi:hypothetical protein
MSEAHVDVTVRVAAEDGDRVIKVLRGAAFRDVRVLNARRTRRHETWTITAVHVETAADAGRERLRIGDVEASLAALGISFEWATHGTGVGSISSEWLNVLFVSTQQQTGFKVSVATKFEVEQELSRVADLLRTQPGDLAVFPQPAWLHD